MDLEDFPRFLIFFRYVSSCSSCYYPSGLRPDHRAWGHEHMYRRVGTELQLQFFPTIFCRDTSDEVFRGALLPPISAGGWDAVWEAVSINFGDFL